jgi:hypothetical protein
MGITTSATDEHGNHDPKFFYLGGMSISVFAGRIKFRDFQYSDRNRSITIMDGSVDIRYWVRRYKKSIGDSGKERLKVRLAGLSCHIYNKQAAYATLRQLAEMTDLQFEEPGHSMYDADIVPSDEKFPETELPWILKIIPVIRANITGGRCVCCCYTVAILPSAP